MWHVLCWSPPIQQKAEAALEMVRNNCKHPKNSLF